MFFMQAGFFMQLAVHCLQGCFIRIHATLGKLPAIIIRSLCPKYPLIIIHDDHGYIRSESVWINHVCIFLSILFMSDVMGWLNTCDNFNSLLCKLC
jgi:hypothetical protein